jgi:replication factor C subunit 3/5
MIHLNASDERGIDIIRNQINQFVNSKSLFNQGMKFVILDEVDYMTKNAQQALRYLLQNYTEGVRFCLICNYISRIDEGLQNEFLRLRFNQLPEKDIISFLKTISVSENLSITDKSLQLIQQLYKSDIRSMINFMQSNQNIKDSDFNIIDDSIWEQLYKKIKHKETIN